MPVRFNGGKLLARLKQISSKLRAGRQPTLRVGFVGGATYPDGTSVAMIAAIQDYGSPANNIPPRPFFRNMVAAKGGEWPVALKEQLKANDYDGRKALSILGEGIAGQLRQSIIDTNDPPLAPATIKRKGHSKPLVDTGLMLQSVDYEVVDK